MIIFNEIEHVNSLLNNTKDLAHKNLKDLQLIAIYFRNKGYNEKEIYDKINYFCKNNIINYNEDTSYKILYKLISNSKNKKLKINDEIIITKNEMKVVLSENNIKIQKILFIYLVLAKYYKKNNNSDKYYVNTNDKDIFDLCKTYTRKNDRLEYMYYLTQKGYITPTLNMSSVVNYVDETSDIVLQFKPDDDLEYYLEQYLGAIFFKCQKCGKLVKQKSNNHKYCKECSKNIKYN